MECYISFHAEVVKGEIWQPHQYCIDTSEASHLAMLPNDLSLHCSAACCISLHEALLSLSMPVYVLGFHLDTCGEGHGFDPPPKGTEFDIMMSFRHFVERASFYLL